MKVEAVPTFHRKALKMKATEIFTPGSFPAHTYVERSGEALEHALRDAIDTPGQVVSLVGPSKSGKTVLVEKVVGRDVLITITGAGIERADEVWGRVLDWMGGPASETKTVTTTGSLEGEAGVSGSANLFGLGKAGIEGKAGVTIGQDRGTTKTFARRGLSEVVREIAKSDFVVLVDDFHYMTRNAQEETAKALKEAVRLGVKVCTAAVGHRGDDLVRANPELRGRVRSIDLNYWDRNDLAEIAKAGFGKLNLKITPADIGKLVQESAGSPQLMQLLCLNTCFVVGVRESLSATRTVPELGDEMKAILEQSSASTDFRSLVDVLDAGPKTRGTERKLYIFSDGTRGDVYKCVLKAVAADPPRLSFKYDELLQRTVAICTDESPVGSSVVGTCLHMGRLAQDKFPRERALDWDENKLILDIPDPYLLFYLRWSGRLVEAE
jgi:hypothetical protein